MGTRDQISIALPLAVTGLALLGWLPNGALGFWQYGRRSAGQASRVRSNFLELAVDHYSGAMSGTIIAGRLKGAQLGELEQSTLTDLLREFDTESRGLLAAYLDRQHPGWRDDVQDDATAGHGGGPRSGKMTEQEAYQIFGLEPGASADAIGRATAG